MSYRPITYCVLCEEPFEEYTAPEDRLCESCKEDPEWADELAASKREKNAEVYRTMKEHDEKEKP